MSQKFAQLFELSLSEKLQLVEDLWDSIASTPEQFPVSDWHEKELELRKAAYLKNPDAASLWETVKERIQNRDV